MTKAPAKSGEQLLHLVFGGELDDVKAITFKDLSKLDVVGFYPNYAEAHKAWLGKARDHRQRGDALFHRPPAPAAGFGDRRDEEGAQIQSTVKFPCDARTVLLVHTKERLLHQVVMCGRF